MNLETNQKASRPQETLYRYSLSRHLDSGNNEPCVYGSFEHLRFLAIERLKNLVPEGEEPELIYLVPLPSIATETEAEELARHLPMFSGTTNWHHFLAPDQHLLITDGVQYLLEATNCTELLFEIARATQKYARTDPFLCIKLSPDGMLDFGDGHHKHYQQGKHNLEIFEAVTLFTQYDAGFEHFVVMLSNEN